MCSSRVCSYLYDRTLGEVDACSVRWSVRISTSHDRVRIQLRKFSYHALGAQKKPPDWHQYDVLRILLYCYLFPSYPLHNCDSRVEFRRQQTEIKMRILKEDENTKKIPYEYRTVLVPQPINRQQLAWKPVAPRPQIKREITLIGSINNNRNQ